MTPDEYCECGSALLRERDFDRALVMFENARRLDASSAKALNGCGAVHLMRGMRERAIDEFSKAVVLDPDYFAPYLNRGMALQQSGEHERAIADFCMAIQLDTENPIGPAARGGSLFQIKRYGDRGAA